MMKKSAFLHTVNNTRNERVKKKGRIGFEKACTHAHMHASTHTHTHTHTSSTYIWNPSNTHTMQQIKTAKTKNILEATLERKRKKFKLKKKGE